MEKIILTADRPTGRLHVGHYVGSLRRRVELQDSGTFDKIYIMVADAQALTDNAENPEKVRQNVIEVALDYLVAYFNGQRVKAFAYLAVFKKEFSHFIKASFNSIFAPPRADIH